MIARTSAGRILRRKCEVSRLNIPLVNENLRAHLFGSKREDENSIDLTTLISDLKEKGIFNENPNLSDGETTKIKFPKLLSDSIVEHTDLAATKLIGQDFKAKIEWLFKPEEFPPRPERVFFRAGSKIVDSIS